MTFLHDFFFIHAVNKNLKYIAAFVSIYDIFTAYKKQMVMQLYYHSKNRQGPIMLFFYATGPVMLFFMPHGAVMLFFSAIGTNFLK